MRARLGGGDRRLRADVRLRTDPATWRHIGAGYHHASATSADGGPTLRLDTSLRLGFEGVRASARTTLHESERAFVALSWGDAVPPESVEDAFRRMEETSEDWRRWVSNGHFPDHRWQEHLYRSALTLKALSHAPSGAIAAAPTTSLPRVPGGSRNWDYRYSFVRDSAWAIRALHALGFSWEADDFLAFLVDPPAARDRSRTSAGSAARIHPTRSSSRHLTGYGGARPVRVGNAAVTYSQHDVLASLVDAATVPSLARRRLSSTVWAMARRQVEEVVDRWREPDRGIWSLRAEPRQYTTRR